jgi:hypothetical protein
MEKKSASQRKNEAAAFELAFTRVYGKWHPEDIDFKPIIKQFSAKKFRKCLYWTLD